MQHRTRSPVGQRLSEQRFGWLLAALVLFVWPAASWHAVTTVHEICPEHGELLDVAATDEAAEGASGDEHDGEGSEGTHEECPFVLLAQPTATDGAAPQWCTQLVEARAHLAQAAAQAHGSVPLLLLAPKQSPPG